MRQSRHNNRWVGLFLLGYLLLNYPLISLFNLKRLAAGIPVLYIYIFSVWAFLILLVMLIGGFRDESQQ